MKFGPVPIAEAVGAVAAHTVRAGEASGSLEHVLHRSADLLERDDATMRKMQEAVTYPALVGLIGIIVEATLQLRPIPSPFMRIDRFPASNVDALLAQKEVAFRANPANRGQPFVPPDLTRAELKPRSLSMISE